MKRLFQISLTVLFLSSAAAQEPPAQRWEKSLRTLHVYDWKALNVLQKLPGSEIITIDGIPTLRIKMTNAAPMEMSVLKITNVSMIKKIYLASFDMKYENLALSSGWNPPDYLALSCLLPPGALGGDESTNRNYVEFSNSTSPASSNWKPYYLRVDREAAEGLPTQLELELHLAGNGTIYLRPIKLLGMVNGLNCWWSPQASGLIGGIGGSLIGSFGALIGLLVSKGKARNFVLAAVKFFIALGILLTIAGLVAVVSKQPYAVWYALLLPGVILVLVFSLNLHSIQRRYDELEIRRMTSIDATGS